MDAAQKAEKAMTRKKTTYKGLAGESRGARGFLHGRRGRVFASPVCGQNRTGACGRSATADDYQCGVVAVEVGQDVGVEGHTKSPVPATYFPRALRFRGRSPTPWNSSDRLMSKAAAILTKVERLGVRFCCSIQP